MKKINIAAGGWPILGEYLLNLQDGATDALKGLGSNMPDCILSGCYIVNTGISTYDCTPGYIKYNGVIYGVPAHSFTIIGGQFSIGYFVPQNTLVPEPYKDGSQPNMVVDTTIKFKGAAVAGVGELAYANLSEDYRLPSDWLMVNEYNVIMDTTQPYFTTNATTGDGSAPGGDLVGYKLRVRIVGTYLEFDGKCITIPNASSGLILATLPAQMRPKYTKRFSIPIYSSDSATVFPPAFILIEANGQVKLITSYTATSCSMDLSGIKVKIKG